MSTVILTHWEHTTDLAGGMRCDASIAGRRCEVITHADVAQWVVHTGLAAGSAVYKHGVIRITIDPTTGGGRDAAVREAMHKCEVWAYT